MKKLAHCILALLVLFEFGRSFNDYYRAEVLLMYDFSAWQFRNEIYGGWRTWMEYRNGGQPFRDIYTIGNKTWWRDYYVDVKHFCNHRVAGDARYEMPDDYWGGRITTVSFGLILK